MEVALLHALIGICKSALAWLWKDTERGPTLPPIECKTWDEGVNFTDVRRWSAEELKKRNTE